MWIHRTRLPHVLPPEAYYAESHHSRELDAIFRPGWHCVGSADDLPRHGDFFTRTLLGMPLLVRNHEGQLRAFLNVCAHRHSLLTSAPCGTMKRLRCQYHGWEYDADGGVAKIPDAACFVPIKKGQERLLRYRTEQVGKLIWVSIRESGPTLREQLGQRTWDFLQTHFGAHVRQGVALELEHPCNWKIPIENVLESYHVPLLHDNFVARHPELFRLFRGKRQQGTQEVHELGDRFTTVHDVLGGDSPLYRSLIQRFRPRASTDFLHLHAFPNVLLGHTAVVSFLHVIHPVTATTCHSMVRIFLDLGQAEAGRLERLVAPLADRLARELFLNLLREDAPIFPAVQRGMAASPQRGVLGSREERIHHFQDYVAAACELTAAAPTPDALA